MNLATFFVVQLALCGGLAFEDAAPPELSSVQAPYVDPELTRAQYAREARRMANYYARAYRLSEAETSALEQRYMALLDAQVEHDTVMRTAAARAQKQLELDAAKNGENWAPSEEYLKKLFEPIQATEFNSPMNGEKLQQMAEENLAPERVEEGRKRFDQVSMDAVANYELEQQGQVIQQAAHTAQVRQEFEGHIRADADASAAGNPLPKPAFVPPPPPVVTQGNKVVAPAPKVVEAPNVEGVAAKLPPAHPGEQRTAPPPVAPPPPAPPVDEWDRHVDSIAGKYKFNGEQKTKAQAILKDLRARAEQYRKSRAAEFERAKRMTNVAEREVEEKALNGPLNELFAELKERIEDIPTAAQREAASVPAPAK